MSLKCSASRRISRMLTANGSSTGPKRSKPFVNNLSPQRMTNEALDYLTQADKRLGRLIQQVGPCRLKLKKHRSPFQALVESVVYQQLNGTAAATILGRVKALYPGRRFPSPEDVLATPDERLRGAGLSRAKTAAIKDIAAKTLAGVVPNSRAI